jgi:hypothetical protein
MELAGLMVGTGNGFSERASIGNPKMIKNIRRLLKSSY